MGAMARPTRGRVVSAGERFATLGLAHALNSILGSLPQVLPSFSLVRMLSQHDQYLVSHSHTGGECTWTCTLLSQRMRTQPTLVDAGRIQLKQTLSEVKMPAGP